MKPPIEKRGERNVKKRLREEKCWGGSKSRRQELERALLMTYL